MATIRSMLGTIEGSAGGITFASRGGKNIMRQKVGSNSSKTVAQQAVRNRFSSIGYLAKTLGALLLAGYKTVGGATAYNRFVGQNYAATSVDQDLVASIDYSKLELSTGSVTALTGVAVTNSSTGQTVSWTNNSNGNQALASDKVYVAIIDIAGNQVYESMGVKTRADGSVIIADAALIGKAASALAVYAFATRADNSDASPTARLAAAPAGVTYNTNIAGPSNTAAGTTLTASAGDAFSFDELTTGSSGPYTMDISIAGTQVASVSTFDRYAGHAFSFTHAGVAHTGVFAAAVNF